MASGLESEAVFTSRAQQIGLSQTSINVLVGAGIKTMGDYAFCCSFQPGMTADETPLIEFLNKTFEREVETASLVKLRRLFFESHTMSVVEMKSRLERSEDDPIRKMAIPERAARHRAQQSRLVGLDLSGEYECSYALIDKVQSQFDSNELKYISVDECTKREQEVLGKKTDEKLKFDFKGGDIKVRKEGPDLNADLASDLRIKNAFVRRCLAYDQCGLITFDVQERWISMLFRKLSEPPEAGYSPVTLEQVLRADQKLFVKMAEETRASIVPKIGSEPPLDVALKHFSTSAEILLLLSPRPQALESRQRGGDPMRAGPYEGQGKGKGKAKGRGKGKGKNKSKEGGGKLKPPAGCLSVTADGRYICFGFNGQGCSDTSVAVGDRCSKGYHICGKKNCHGSHSLGQCPKP